MKLPKDIKIFNSAFKKAGYSLYVVGGAVRDHILNIQPKDYDLATEAYPDAVIKIAKENNWDVVEVGKSFGVVIVNGYEIATFRTDIGKGRRPDSVNFSTIEEDVKRRDLTINALFYDIDNSKIVDLVGGVSDIKNKRIKTVGNAELRFEEDTLRKLRVLRFAGALGATIEINTYNALKNNNSLTGVSYERIRDEFIKSIQKAKSVKSYLQICDELGFLEQIFPNLKLNKDFVDVDDYIVCIAYLLKDNKAGSLENKLKLELKYNIDEVKSICGLIDLLTLDNSNVFRLKKKINNTKLTSTQIRLFGKLNYSHFDKFIEFNLTIAGKDIPSNLKGVNIGKWIENKEIENYNLIKI